MLGINYPPTDVGGFPTLKFILLKERLVESMPKNTKNTKRSLLSIVIVVAVVLAGLLGVHSLPELYTKILPKQQQQQAVQTDQKNNISASGTDLANLQDNGSAYIEVDGNVPNFPNKETSGHIDLTELDSLGRCGPVYCCLGPET